MPNGTGARGQSGRPPTGLPSPRLGPHAPNNQTSGLPPSPQMSMPPTMSMWPQPYYVSPSFFFSKNLQYIYLHLEPARSVYVYWYSARPMQAHPPTSASSTPPPRYAYVSPKSFCKSAAFHTDTTTYTPNPCSRSNSASTYISPIIFARWIDTDTVNTIFNNKNSECYFIFICPKESAILVSLKTPDGVAVDLENRRTAPTPNTSSDTDKAVLGHPTRDRQAFA